MSTAQRQVSEQESAVTTSGRDDRTFWRILLAIVAPLPLLGMGLSYALNPVPAGADVPTTVVGVAEHRGIYGITSALVLFFVIGLIPATFALMQVARRRAPVLTIVGGVWALLGLLA